MATLPTPQGDAGTWGDELNEYLRISHTASGAISTTEPASLGVLQVSSIRVFGSAILFKSSTTLTPNANATLTLERNASGNYVEFLGSVTADEHGMLWSSSSGSPAQVYFNFNLGRLTIAASGSTALIGGNVGLGTVNQFGSGSVVVGLANAIAVPASNPTGGGVLYAQSGALVWRGSGGTVTTIASA